jgi:hypothetical protein
VDSVSDKAAKTLAERQPGQLLQVERRPGEDVFVHMVRALYVNQLLLFGDMLRRPK